MSKFFYNLPKNVIRDFVSVIWTIAAIIIFLGFVEINPQSEEKIYAIAMLILGYYLNKPSTKDGKKDE